VKRVHPKPFKRAAKATKAVTEPSAAQLAPATLGGRKPNIATPGLGKKTLAR
jgi:hypothetical protein